VSIVRAPRPESQFTQLRNDVLRDKRLSFRARGILAWILSQPDNWATDADRLAREGTEGRDAIRTALRELRGAGYVVQARRQNDLGRWVTDTLVYDTPQETAGQTEGGKPAVGSPDVGCSDAIRTTTTNNYQEQGSAGSGATKPPHDQARRRTRDHRDKQVTKADQSDFEALKTLCARVGEDDPISVWWTLRKEHNAASPHLFMAKLVEYGEWEGFVGSHGIGEYQPNGEAA